MDLLSCLGFLTLLSKADLVGSVVSAQLLPELLWNLLSSSGFRDLGNSEYGSGGQESSLTSEFSAALLYNEKYYVTETKNVAKPSQVSKRVTP